jgi:hypothetical protein
MKPYLLTAWIVALVAGSAWAQEKKDAPPQPSDNGPSLEVSMKFIRDKMQAKTNEVNATIEADPVKCELRDTRTEPSGQLRIREAFSFREVENIEVMPAQEYFRQVGSEDSAAEAAERGLAGFFTLKVLMATKSSVHQRYTEEEKKRLHLEDKDSGEMKWWFGDEDVANRVAKAMIHAVELCGGGSKPEPF